MNRKIIGIIICMLLLVTTVLPIAAMQQQKNGYGTGFLPPEMDLSHLTGQELPERFIGETPPSSYDWRTLGKVTSVKDQGALTHVMLLLLQAVLNQRF